MRALLAGLAVLAGCAAAQDCATVSELLQSPDLQKKAWSAYLAGHCDQRERGPELAAELDQMLPDRVTAPNAPEYWLVQSLLDALIQLQQPVAPSTALAFHETWPNESLILLVQNAQAAQQQLLFLLDTRLTDPEWLAATNSLVALKTGGFAAKLTRETRFTLALSVVDPGAGFGGGAGGAVFGGRLGPGGPIPDGFPPVGIYGLVLKAVPGDTLLAAGAHPVYYRRTVTAPGQPVSPSGDGGFTDHLGYRLEHLSTLSGLPLDTVRSAVEGAPQIQWHTFDAYVLDRDAAIDAQTEAVTRLATALQSTGALTGPKRPRWRSASMFTSRITEPITRSRCRRPQGRSKSDSMNHPRYNRFERGRNGFDGIDFGV